MIKNIYKSVKGGQKAKNDDRVFCKSYNDPLLVNKLNLVAIAAVADGVGGVKGGEKASAIAVKELESRVERHKSFGSLKDIDEFFKNTYKEINQIILKEQEKRNFPDMCTTLVSAGLFRTTGTEQCYLFIVNCGDSPLLCIDTDRDEIELLSAIHHTGDHLTQYLGKRNLEIHNSYCRCPKNGFILLCSDGLTGNMANSPFVSKEEIKKYLVETKNIDEASEILIRLAPYKGSSDDISVAILEVGKPKRMKPKHLTPIASRRYWAIAERLVYAGCILLSIIGVFYYRSNNVKLNENLEDKINELQVKEKEINKLNDDLRSKAQEGKNILWELETKSAKIKEIVEEKEKLSDTVRQQKKLLVSKDNENKSRVNNAGNKVKEKTKEQEGQNVNKSKEKTDSNTNQNEEFKNIQGSETSNDGKNNEHVEGGKKERPKNAEITSQEIINKVKVVEDTGKGDSPLKGVKVRLDKKNIGETRDDGMISIKGEVGQHELQVEKDGFLPVKETITMSNDSDLQQITIKLKRNNTADKQKKKEEKK